MLGDKQSIMWSALCIFLQVVIVHSQTKMSAPSTRTMPHLTCNFEDNKCGYADDKNDDFDWTRKAGPTSSTDTGPPSDHTFGNSSGHYMYIETSAPRRLGRKARLLSPLVNLPGTNCIKFFYYMYGASVDTLSVYVKEDHSNLSFPVWRRTGTQGTKWTEGRFPVTKSQGFQLVFEGVRGNGYQGDIAIDDITVKQGNCDENANRRMNIELTSGVYPVTVKIAAHVISELDPLTTEIDHETTGTTTGVSTASTAAPHTRMPSTKITTSTSPRSPVTASQAETNATTTVTVMYNTQETIEKSSSLWSVPFIVLVAVCSLLLLVCIVCVVIICRLKKSLKKRSKLYPGVTDEEDHHYMDLGDHPLRDSPAVELKSVTATRDGETNLSEVNDKAKMKPYKDRKRKPPPPLPTSPVPNIEDKEKLANDKRAKAVPNNAKRQVSVKKLSAPNYNNSDPLDISDDEDIGLYESYDYSNQHPDSYNMDMIEDGLLHSEETGGSSSDIIKDEKKNSSVVMEVEKRRHSSTDSQVSVNLRKKKDSIVTTENNDHECLQFTERQISTSGLPESVIRYSVSNEPENPLDLKDDQTCENNAFEQEKQIGSVPVLVQNHCGDVLNDNTITNPSLTYSETTIMSNLDIYEFVSGDSSSSAAVYDDHFIPVTTCTENENTDAPPLYEDAVEMENSHVVGPFYDDNLLSVTTSSENKSIDIDILPLYEDAEDNSRSESPLGHSKALKTTAAVSAVTAENDQLYDDSKLIENQVCDINDLGVYEDYELNKLPPAPPPPVGHSLNAIFSNNDSKQAVPAHSQTEKHKPPANWTPEIDFRKDSTYLLDQNERVMINKSESDGCLTEQNDSESNDQTQNNHVNTARLLDLSLKPEKVRSGSKIDIFDTPSITNSPEKYFLDMKDFPSEIVDSTDNDASPVIDDDNSITIIKNDSNTTTSNILAPISTINAYKMHPTNNSSENKTNEPICVLNQTLTFEANWDQTNHTCQKEPIKTGEYIDLLDDNNHMLATDDNLLPSAVKSPEVTENGDVQMEMFTDDEFNLYDTPPPNYPPPELKW